MLLFDILEVIINLFDVDTMLMGILGGDTVEAACGSMPMYMVNCPFFLIVTSPLCSIFLYSPPYFFNVYPTFAL